MERRSRLTLVVLLSFLAISPSVNALTPIKDVTFLGMTLANTKTTDVRKQMWNLGGFLQSDSTVKQRNLDKFYTWSNLRESYYIVFKYNNAEKIYSVMQLFRHYTKEKFNRGESIRTRDVAKDLITQLGKPTQILRKGRAGTPNYQSFVWQDDDVKIMIDRVGGEINGNIFVEYTLKKIDRYLVEDNKPTR